LKRPFFFWCAVFLAACAGPAAADDCAATQWDERVTIKQVFDGDTVELTDGRHVRFIGVNAPEVEHQPAPAQPLAEEAKRRVEQAFAADRTALLRYDAERFDVHKRTLAHLYRADKRSVEAELLEIGLAFSIAIPPNLAHADCYAAKEREARAQKRGIWAQSYYNPVAAADVTADRLGFQRVRGVVQRVGQSKKSIWLNLSRNVALRVDREDLRYFTAMNLQEFKGRELEARGWITQFKNGDFVMRVRHPAALEVR
jgi:endonuclease YncB( thermonuclease family)